MVTAKRRARWASVASGLALLMAGASAQGLPDGHQPGRNGGERGVQRMVHVDEPRPDQMSPRDPSAPVHPNRLSPEERRQLRRDVHDAGRDLYPDKMPRGRHQPRR